MSTIGTNSGRGATVTALTKPEPSPGTAPRFDLFVGVDWSGAKGPRVPGLQVALADPDGRAPQLLPNPAGGHWRRSDFETWLSETIQSSTRILVGFDFAPAYASADEGAYFPDVPDAPADAKALWSLVDRLASDDPELYGMRIAHTPPFSAHYLTPKGRGSRYRYRQRLTETVCAAITTPHPVLKCIGAANVGTGSLAGMRLFNRLAARFGSKIAFWPFDDVDQSGASAVLVESFPRVYYMAAGADARAWAEPETMARVYKAYGSKPSAAPVRSKREDEADALVIAAALRHFSQDPGLWRRDVLPEAAVKAEGWIFGVRADAAPRQQ